MVFSLIYPNCNPGIICWTRYILGINHLSPGTYTPVNTDHIPNPLNFHFPSLLLLFFPFLLDLHTQNQRTWCHTRCQRVEKKRSSGPGFLYQLMRDLRETEREREGQRKKETESERERQELHYLPKGICNRSRSIASSSCVQLQHYTSLPGLW